MRSHHRFAHSDEPVAQAVPADALGGDACSLEQQEQFVRQHLGLGKLGGRAQINNALPLRGLEGFDDPARGVIFLGNLNRCIGERTAAPSP